MPLLRPLLILLLAAIVAGCGFQLRGTQGGNLPYKTMFIALPETADVRIWLERYIRHRGNRIVGSAQRGGSSFQQLQTTAARKTISASTPRAACANIACS
jgi:LPS-assembly lipoprotein